MNSQEKVKAEARLQLIELALAYGAKWQTLARAKTIESIEDEVNNHFETKERWKVNPSTYHITDGFGKAVNYGYRVRINGIKKDYVFEWLKD